MPKGVYERTEAHKSVLRTTNLGRTPWNRGLKGVQKVSDETRAKLSAARLGNQHAAGENSGHWKGGITADNKKFGVYVKRRRARKAGAEGSHTLQEWLELVDSCGNVCACCKEPKALTRDHIVPLSKGGSDFISNIQPLCRECNSRKSVNVHCYLGNS